MRKSAAVLGLVVFSASPVNAQTNPPVLTLEQAVARVRVAGFEVRMARADAALAAADATTARSLLRPQIGLSANALDANETQLGMPIARQAYGAATLSIPLYTPANSANARAARETARVATIGISSTTNDAVFAVISAYRRVQLGDAILEARNVAVADQQHHLQVTEERVTAGKAARYVTFRDSAALANAKQAQEDAAADRDQAANDLEALLDADNSPLSVQPLTRVPFEGSRAALLAQALRQRPDLLAAEQRVLAARTSIAAAKAAYLPAATLTAQSYNGNSSPALGRSGGEVQLTASLPIVDGGSRAAAQARARAQYDRAQALRDQTRAGVVRDVENAWRELQAADRNFATASAVSADAQEQLRLANLRESAGKAIDIEVLDALSVAAGARETIARSLARYDLAVSALQHALGDASL